MEDTGPESTSSARENSQQVKEQVLRRLSLIVEYDGTNYNGFQLQRGQSTIQGELEKALAKFTGEHIRIRGASRTDSGAHAKGQVVDFLSASAHPVDQFPKALNYYLPKDIVVQAAQQVSLEFNSRRDATSRVYRYNILNRPWPSPLRRYTHFTFRGELQVARMESAAQGLVGIHDFRALAAGHPPDRSAVRQVYRWDVWREGDTIIIECEGNGFLRHQIRKANALLIEAGKGSPESIVSDVLLGKLETAIPAGVLPAHGLCLMKVKYPCGDIQAGGPSRPPITREKAEREP